MTSADAVLARTRRAVIKVGSALLVDWETGALDRARLSAIADDIAALRARGAQVVVVSSGAVALGRLRLGLPGARLTLDLRQAAAAAGQSMLMRAWEEALEPVGVTAAQILLTRDDTETRRRWLNARATVQALLDLGCVPVINENDTVSTEEIRYGDNDRLAARAAQMIGADCLVLLSDIDGLFDADPRRNPDARHIPWLDSVTPEALAFASGANADRAVGSGGMATKLAAAQIAADAGCFTVIADGQGPGSPLARLADGARATVIASSSNVRAAYKQWIGGSLAPQGELFVDAGCARALATGKSLLAAGLTGVSGAFRKGDPVLIRDAAGAALGRGLSRYDAPDAARIAGLKSADVATALGWPGGPVVVHADDLALQS